jgi:prepilin-type N-terminal cleavage/methylation domain-containing protein
MADEASMRWIMRGLLGGQGRVTGAARRRPVGTLDEGFSLIESVVALTVAALIFTALAGIVMNSLSATILARQVQQAIDLTTQAVETARDLDYATLGLNSTDGGTDTAIVSGKYTVKLSNGTTSAENVVYVASTPASLNPHKKTLTLDGTAFTVSQYVTTPPTDAAAATAAYKRLTIDVAWKRGTATKHKISSTFISVIRRGLPQPKFIWAFSGATNSAQPGGLSANQGAAVTISTVLTNRGARDRWNVTTTAKDNVNATRLWQFAWYNDNGAGSNACDGVRESDENTRMDPNTDGIADTGTIDTDKVVCLVGQYTLPVTESTASAPVTVTVTATSNAVNTISSALATKVTVLSQTCSGCTYRGYYLKSSPSGVTTPATSNLPLVKQVASPSNAPTTAILPVYSNDVDLAAGRFVPRGAVTTGTDPKQVANWVYQVPTSCTFTATTAYLNLYGVPADLNADDAGGFTVQLRYETAVAGVYTDWGTAATKTVTNWGYSSYAGLVVPITLPALTLAANKKIDVRIVVPAASTTDMRLAYDTASYPAILELPVSGSGTC